MKRMTPFNRDAVADNCLNRMFQAFTCSYGEWNRDKILASLKRKLSTKLRKDKVCDTTQNN